MVQSENILQCSVYGAGQIIWGIIIIIIINYYSYYYYYY